METRALMEKEMEMETNVVKFPIEREIQVVSFVNTPNILIRNAKANAYIESCKRKEEGNEDFWCILSGLSVCAMIVTMYFIGIIL